MSLLSCPQGHRWEAAAPTGVCPSCGVAALTETLLPPPLPDVPTPATLPPEGLALPSTLAPQGVSASPSARPSVLPPGYEMLGELGRGGMGVVYKARHVALKRIVALKMILSGDHAGKQERERFRVEAEAVARLQHPGIVQVFEVGEHGEHPFCALEYVDGGNLAGTIRGTPRAPRPAAHLVEQLARAMQHAHEHGIIHRDLKPGNVLLAADGSPKIADFGLAKRMDAANDLSRSGMVVGTPSYMPPEQALGQVKDIGPTADVYSLGALLYELLTGRPPFTGATVLDTMAQVIGDEPVPPSRLVAKVPADLETVCLKCLQKKPGRRYASAGALAEDLGRYQRGEPVLARPVGRLERGWRWCARNKAVASLAAGMALTLLLGTVVATSFALYANQKAYDEKIARNEADRKTVAERRAREATDDALRELATQKEETDAESKRKSAALLDLAAQKKETDSALEQSRFEQKKAEFVAYSFRLDAARQSIKAGHPGDALSQLKSMYDPKLCGWEHDFLICTFRENPSDHRLSTR